jgi:tetratricopeptide (TPR) repeat protein
MNLKEWAYRLGGKKRRTIPWVAFSLVILFGTGGPLTAGNPPNGSASRAIARIESRLATAIEYIFREDYAVADSICEEIIADHPDHPAGYFMKGILYWKKGYYRPNYDDYNDSTLYWLKKAIKIAKKRIKKNPQDASAYFFGGGAYGYEGSVYARRKKWLKTGYAAYRGIRFLEQSRALDSTLYDVYYGSGLYHVLASHQPGVVRWIQKLLPIPSGNAELGIRYLQIAAQKGRFTRLAALAGLAMSYIYYDNKYQEAINLLEPLVDRYPANLDFLLSLINAYFYQGLVAETDWKRLQQLIRHTRVTLNNRNVQIDRWWLDKFNFMEGYAHFMLGHLTEAKLLLEAYTLQYSEKGESYLTALAHLTLGKIYDLEGNRSRAVQHYRKVSKYEQMGNEREIARYLLSHPYTEESAATRFRGAYAELPDRP